MSGLCPLTLRGHDREVVSVSWSPDGTRLASGSDDKTVRIWEVATGKELSQLTGHQSRVSSVHFSPDGKRLVSGSSDKTLMFWDPSTGEQLCQLKVNYMVSNVAYSPDGSKLAAAHYKSVSIFNVETSEVQCTVNVGYTPPFP